MFKSFRLNKFAVVALLVSVGAFASVAYATHSWGGYHWARIASPFTLKLVDSVTTNWNSYLGTTSTDWSVASTTVLGTAIAPGDDSSSTRKRCPAVLGKDRICNAAYGNNGWLGIASIWVSGSHITQGTVKLNDTYFNTATYNTPAWRQFVMCQEVGHTFGLDHQDVDFYNTNLGTCMDYTNDPARNDGSGDNQHPNAHDYDELGIIYQHLDAITTIFSAKSSAPALTGDDIDTSNPSEWGKVIRKSGDGRSSIHERDLGKGNKIFTFVIWAN